MPIQLVQPARVDFSGVGDLPGHYMQAQNQAQQLRALAEQREQEQQQRAAIGALDLEQPLVGQLGPLVQSGAVGVGDAFNLKQQDAAQRQAEQRRANIQRGLFGDGQNPGILAQSGLTQEDIQAFSLMDPEDALKAYQDARKGTDDIREYNFARQQGYQGSFRDFMLSSKRAGATNITNNVDASQGPQVGTIPQGFQLNAVAGPDGNIAGYRMEPIPGGPADREINAEEEAAEQAATSAAQTAQIESDVFNTGVSDILRLGGDAVIPTTGFVGGIASNIGSTNALAVKNKLKTLQGAVGFRRLQRMREESTTGGALGAINKTEMDLLTSSLGVLDQELDGPEFYRALRDVQLQYNRVIHGPQFNLPESVDRQYQQLITGESAPNPMRAKYGLE